MVKKVRIAIVDSGVSYPHPGITGKKPKGIAVLNRTITDDYDDNMGHGTAIYGLIHQLLPEADIFIVKIFDKSLEPNINDLFMALDYLKERDIDILHFSNGIPILKEYKALKNRINWFVKHKKLIIASCDNLGCNSYPAAFENVISVDVSKQYSSNNEYEYLENSLTNVRIKGGLQRVCWNNGQYLFVSGASYSSPYVTAMLGKWIQNNNNISFNAALSFLKQNATKQHSFSVSKFPVLSFSISNAIIFPLNKETHSLFTHNKLCNFNIVGVYSHRMLGICGKKISQCLSQPIQLDLIIKNFSEIDWNSNTFDTIILGHIFELSRITNENLMQYFIQKCIKHNKKIYSFDPLNDYIDLLNDNKIEYYYPVLTKNMIPKGRLGKLFLSSTPIIGIFGTSSKQGKFNLQLDLRERFKASGYKIGQIGTEPNSYLFGFDTNFSYGYNSSIELSESDTILILNDEIQKIESKNVDAIIVGTQGGVIPYSKYNLDTIPKHQVDFFAAIDFDYIILCINTFDTEDYIRRNILYIEGYTGKKVMALVLFPRKRCINQFGLSENYKNLIPEELEVIKQKLISETGKNVYINGNENDIDNLYEEIINFFSE